jgi:bifunctional non-homologous end joining protein LigD
LRRDIAVALFSVRFSKPSFIAPMLCKGARQLPSREGWLYEVKQDGYRALAVKDGDQVSVFSRNGKPLNYPGVKDAVRRVRVRSAVLDCELLALDKEGKPCFEALATADPDCTARLYAFDLLHLNGRDLTTRPIEERKKRLRSVTDESPVLFSPAFDCEPGTLVAEVKRLGLEGIVAKRRGSTYRPGERNGAWVKVRVNQEGEFIIGGYRPGNPLESVLVGYRDGRKLLFAGNVHAGLNASSRREWFAALKDLQQARCPFANLPDRRRDRWNEGITAVDMAGFVWLKPKLKIRVAFREWTSWGRLRHPVLGEAS